MKVNVADVKVAGTVTEDGTIAADGLLLDRVTETPPEGAGPFSVSVPIEYRNRLCVDIQTNKLYPFHRSAPFERMWLCTAGHPIRGIPQACESEPVIPF